MLLFLFHGLGLDQNFSVLVRTLARGKKKTKNKTKQSTKALAVKRAILLIDNAVL